MFAKQIFRLPKDKPLCQAGYVTAFTAFILVPLLAFAGLAVDAGSWYSRAVTIQRTADSAALAAAAALPRGMTAAEAAAHSVAAQNGITAGVNGIIISSEQTGADQVKVTITDPNVPQYLTAMFRSDVSITRSSTAEYVPAVRMGSPRNFLGTGTLEYWESGLPVDAVKEEFFLSINSPCALTEDGDLVATQWLGSYGINNQCNPGTRANPTYNPDGYIYGVKVDDDYRGGSMVIEIFDAPMCNANTTTGYLDLPRLGNSSFTTTYTVRSPAPNPFEGQVLQRHTLVGVTGNQQTGDCRLVGDRNGWRGGWKALATINDPKPGSIYGVQVQSSNHTSNTARGNLNNFALRARTGNSFVACSSDPFESDPTLQVAATGVQPENCPNVFAFENLSVYAGSQGSTAQFFLASIGQEHSGKTLVIDLYDPGEGGDTLRLVDPANNYATFTYRVVQRFAGENDPSGGWGPFNNRTVVNVGGTGNPPGSNRLSEYLFNERQLRLEVQLPPNIEEVYGGRTWWRVEYKFSGEKTVTDRTTWSVGVRGNPVRLVE